jgi:hypothetical protein
VVRDRELMLEDDEALAFEFAPRKAKEREVSEYRNLNNLHQHPKIAFSDDDRVPTRRAPDCVYDEGLSRHTRVARRPGKKHPSTVATPS